MARIFSIAAIFPLGATSVIAFVTTCFVGNSMVVDSGDPARLALVQSAFRNRALPIAAVTTNQPITVICPISRPFRHADAKLDFVRVSGNSTPR